jgi:beta-lactamase class A
MNRTLNLKFIARAALIIILAGFAAAHIYSGVMTLKERHELYQIRLERWNEFKSRIEDEIAGFAHTPCIVIEDLSTGWEVRHNDDLAVASASLVKVPIMAGVLLASENGGISLDETITMRRSDKVGGSGRIKAYPSGSKFVVLDLIKRSITESDNTATNLLIKRMGFDYYAGIFPEMGLDRTNLSRLMMDMKSRDAGVENYTTAGEMALVFRKIYEGTLFGGEISRLCLKILKEQKSTDRIPAKIPEDVEIAHKTGLERGVCHDAGIVFTDNGDFLIVVLVKHDDRNSRRSKRFIADLAYLAYGYFTQDEPRTETDR